MTPELMLKPAPELSPEPGPELTPEQLDAFAAAFATLGQIHRKALDASGLAAFLALRDQWPLLDTPKAREGLAALTRSAKLGESAEQISADHNWLYGDTARAAVPPYESVHRGVEALLFDEATLQVRAAYRELGLVAPRLNREPDDHIGLEFDFLAQASLKAQDALADARAGDAEQFLDAARDFLHEHVQQWAPGMLGQVAAGAGTQFMAGVALLSLGALESLAAALD